MRDEEGMGEGGGRRRERVEEEERRREWGKKEKGLREIRKVWEGGIVPVGEYVITGCLFIELTTLHLYSRSSDF